MILEDIQKKLENQNFTCSFFPGNHQIAFDRLLISIDLDSKKRERILAITATEQEIDPQYAIREKASLPSRIQFRLELPFKIDDLSLNQVASLLLFLNQFIDLPGFELDELNGKVIYRYVWITISTSIEISCLMSILGAVMVNLSLFSDTIESLAEGKVSFNELLSQIIDLRKNSFA